MSESASISTGIASRYATAVFELSKESGGIGPLESDVETLTGILTDSADFRDLIQSPVYGRDAQKNAVAAVAERAGLTDTTKNALALMASKRRLFVLPALVRELARLIAEEKGEVEADVVSAQPLSDEQRGRLEQMLTSSIGKDVKLNTSVDEDLIGGLVVKVGSRMIDTSIRSKLAALRNTMKEVG